MIKDFFIKYHGRNFLKFKKYYLHFFPRIRHIVLMVNNYCNLRCSFCGLWKLENKQDLSLEKAKYLLDSLRKKPKSFQFTGGEPFLRDDFFDFYSYFQKRIPAAKKYITTNATLPHQLDSFLKAVKPDKNLSITLSFNGREEEIIRQRPKSFQAEAFLESLALLENKYPRVKRTVKQIVAGPETFLFSKLYDYAKQHGCGLQFKFLEFAPSFTQQKNSKIYRKDFVSPSFFLNLSRPDKELLRERIRNFLRMPLDSSVIGNFHQIYLGNILLFLRKNRLEKGPCNAAGNYIEVWPDGKIYPCRYLQKKVDCCFLNTRGSARKINTLLKDYPNCPHSKGNCLAFWNFYI